MKYYSKHKPVETKTERLLWVSWGIEIRMALLVHLLAWAGVMQIHAGQTVDVLTHRNSNYRDAANTRETGLTPTNVNPNQFGKLFAQPVVGNIEGQPLLVNQVNCGPMGIHNVVFVTTEANHVYAFDADSADGPNSKPLWHVDFTSPDGSIASVPSQDMVPSGNTYSTSPIYPLIGITATPVIDKELGTIFIESFTKRNGAYVHMLHALDIASGSERVGSPVIVSATVKGTNSYDSVGGIVSFDPHRHVCRAGLTLCSPVAYGGKVVFLAYGSLQDNFKYHGWIIGYDAVTLNQVGVFCSTPNGSQGSFWMTFNGLSADENGNVYGISANGTFDDKKSNYGDSVVKISTDRSGLHLSDWFAPFNATTLNTADLDLGTGGFVLLPPGVGPADAPNLGVFTSKEGRVYLLNRDNLGKFNSVSDSQVPQWWWLDPGQTAFKGNRIGSPSYYNKKIIFHSPGNNLLSFALSSGVVDTNSVITPVTQGLGGFTTISANGSSNAVAWELVTFGTYGSKPIELLAFAVDATNSPVIYRSSSKGTRDRMAPGVLKSMPVVANSKVYAGCIGELDVFGLGTWPENPLISPAGGNFQGTTNITLSCSTPSSRIYYTVDGQTPTTNSTIYSGPISITQSVTISAIATAPNRLPSGVTTAVFVNLNTIGSGTGLLGQYWSNVSLTFAGSPALVRTDSVVNFNFDPPYTPDSTIDQKFSCNWTGSILAQVSGPHTIYLFGADGKRLKFNGQWVINDWFPSLTPVSTYTTNLISGQKYAIEFDHFQSSYFIGQPIQLAWSSPSTTTTPIPQSQLFPPVIAAAPSVSITGIPGTNLVQGGTLTLLAQAASTTASVLRVDFLVDGTIVQSVLAKPYSITLSGLFPGSHQVWAQVTDDNGNVANSQSLSISVDSNSSQQYGMDTRPTLAAYLGLPSSASASMPSRLSMTGVFTNTSGFGLTSGLIPFKPAAPFWSDGAIKSRWFGIPYGGGTLMPANQITFSQDGNWDFPVGSIFVKHFDLQTNQVLGTAPRRLETRLLAYDGNGGVHGATYRWRSDGSDADLVTSSQTEDIIVTTTNGTQVQTWYYPSQSDCVVCHNSVSGGVLGVSKTRQQNFSEVYPQTGILDNQLRVLNHLGMLNPAIDETGISSLPHYAAASDNNSSLELRARSFLDVNCSYCHQPGGAGRASFDLRITTALTNANLINGGVAATFGLPNAAAVVPGNPLSSTVYHRVNTATPGIMMPPLARSIIDQADQSILGKWIYSLASTNSSVVGRYIYDNNSAMDGSNPAANYLDDLAIATDKAALLPGGAVDPSNYTSYSEGLDGILIDVTTLPGAGSLSLADFAFATSAFDPTTDNESSPAAWSPAPVPAGMSVRVGDGIGGSDRIDFAWASGVLNSQWLRVTVLATTNTGLAVPDVFYFGTAPKIVPQIVTLPSASGITYGQSLLASTLTGGTATTPGTFSFSSVTTVPNVGSYLASVTFVPNDTASYAYTTFQVPVLVNPAPSSVSVSGLTQLGYNGVGQGPKTATVVGSTNPAVFTYASVDGVTYSARASAPTNVGSYKVTASVAADSNHLAATSTPLTFVINSIPLTVSANPQTKVYGRTLSLGAGQTSFTASGLTNSETVGSVTLTASGGTAATAGVGTYSLTPSLAVGGTFKKSNYTIGYVPGTLTVTRTNSTIAVTGGTNFNYNGLGQGPKTATVVGSTNPAVFTYASVDGVTYSARASAPTNVGSYKVTASVAADSNHLAATSTPLTFTISPIPLTITASDQTKVYGTTLSLGASSIGFSVMGLVGSDVVDSVTISASGGTQLNAPIGTYILRPSAASGTHFSSNNYLISYINGMLTVESQAVVLGTSGPEVPLLSPWGIAVLLSGMIGVAMRAARRSN